MSGAPTWIARLAGALATFAAAAAASTAAAQEPPRASAEAPAPTSASASASASAPARFAEVAAFVERGVAAARAPSVALAVVENDATVWARGFGRADVERAIPATAESVYLLASVSKPMTATGLMILVDDGRIDLDAPVNAYLPGTKVRAHRGDARAVTVRRLANHTAGMPVHWSFFYEGTEPPPFEELLRRFAFTWREPGTAWEYCNLGFGILDYVIELRSGETWRRFMERRVYDPAGMTRTSDHVREGLERSATARYVREASGKLRRLPRYGFGHDGASACWSSADDLARFLRVHLNDGVIDGVRVLSAAAAREMRRRTSVREGRSGNGVGWFVDRFDGHASVAHSGGMPGVTTHIRAFPDLGAGIVVLTNCGDRGFCNDIAARLSRALVGGRAAPAAADDDGAAEAARSPEPRPLPAAAWQGTWIGRVAHFDGDLDVRLTIPERGPPDVQIGSARSTLTRRARVGDTLTLIGPAFARIGTQPGFEGVPELELRLRLEDDDTVAGLCVLQAPGYFCHAHWLLLHKEP